MNVLELLQQQSIEPKRVSGHKGGEFHSPCPGCGGDDRFHVWPAQNDGEGSWWCRRCGKGGDGVQFLVEFCGKEYREAFKIMGREQIGYYQPRTYGQKPAAKNTTAEWKPTDCEPPPEIWRNKSRKFTDQAHTWLMEHGQKQLQWLAARGIDRDTAERFHLGYCPGKDGKDLWRPRESWGLPTEIKDNGKKKRLWLPRGLVIPCIIDDQVRRLRIRRPDGEPRYYVVPGSAGDILLARRDRRAVVVVEAELDAMAVDAAAGDLVTTAAMGSSASYPDRRCHDALDGALVILNALDFDAAGAKYWRRWRRQYAQARRWPVPAGKDPGEAFQAGVDLRAWVLAGLPPALTVGRFSLVCDNREEFDFPVIEDSESGGDQGAGVVELGELLRQYPVQIECTSKRTRIIEHPGWAGKDPDVSRRISELVFFDADVWAYLKAHTAEIIDRVNYQHC